MGFARLWVMPTGPLLLVCAQDPLIAYEIDSKCSLPKHNSYQGKPRIP